LAAEPEGLGVGEGGDEEGGKNDVVVADAEMEEGRSGGFGRSKSSSEVDGGVEHARKGQEEDGKESAKGDSTRRREDV